MSAEIDLVRPSNNGFCFMATHGCNFKDSVVAELRRFADALEDGSVNIFQVTECESSDNDDYVGTSEVKLVYAKRDATPDPMMKLHAALDAQLAARGN